MKHASNTHSARAQFLGYTKPQEEPSEPTQGDPAAKVEVISFAPPHKSRTTGTPFGGKVEAVLRLAGIPYVGLKGNVTNPKHAPKHKARPRTLPRFARVRPRPAARRFEQWVARALDLS